MTDEMREAVEAAARWYGAGPADAHREAELDAVEAEVAMLPASEQAAALKRLGLGR